MYCSNCGTKIIDDAQFCRNCGKATEEKQDITSSRHIGIGQTEVKSEDLIKYDSSDENTIKYESSKKDIIKCGNCEYIGEGEKARSLFFTILAWVCLPFVPLITIIYFVATNKFQCPKCKSTFLGVKNKKGVFVGQRGGAKRPIFIFLWILLGIAIIGILSTIVLVSLNTAREKAKEAQSSSTEALINEAVVEAKKGTTLPNQLNEYIRWVDITAEPNAVRYHYVFSNIDSSQLTNDNLKNDLIPNICDNNDTKSLLNRGINMEYSYVIKDTQQTYFFTITKNDCQF